MNKNRSFWELILVFWLIMWFLVSIGFHFIGMHKMAQEAKKVYQEVTATYMSNEKTLVTSQDDYNICAGRYEKWEQILPSNICFEPYIYNIKKFAGKDYVDMEVFTIFNKDYLDTTLKNPELSNPTNIKYFYKKEEVARFFCDKFEKNYDSEFCIALKYGHKFTSEGIKTPDYSTNAQFLNE